MPTVEKLQKEISEETMLRVFGDNDVENTIVNETVVRNEADNSIKIKIANESTDRASKDTTILQKLSDEVQSRVKTIESLKRRIGVLEQIVGSVDKTVPLPESIDDKTDDKTVPEPVEDKLMISQEMFERELNMLKRSAKFILDSTKKDDDGEISKVITDLLESKEKSQDFLIYLNNLQVSFDNLLVNQDKYTLTEETKKCISESNELKIELTNVTNEYWDVERLFVDKGRTKNEYREWSLT